MNLKEWTVLLLKSLCKQCLKFMYLFPIRNNRIIFCAYKGRQYSCNPRFIYEKLISEFSGKFEIIWVLNHEKNIPNNTICVARNSFKYAYYMMTSKVLVDNWGFNAFIPYRKNQLKINTWHAGGAYKKVGIDTDCSSAYRKRLKIDGTSTDIVLSSSQRFSEVFAPSHCIDFSKMRNIGMPRNDILLHPNAEKTLYIRRQIGISQEQKLILYAPTYRGDFLNASFKNITFDNVRCLNALQKRFGSEWILGFRMHYAYDSDISAVTNAINLSSYPDMQELLLAADVLITDYSSSIWDFSFTGKPCFIFANDLAQYKSDVDFYTPIEQWPFSIAMNNEQLVQNILNFDQNSYVKAVKQHHEDLGSCETGRASEIVAKAIYDYCFHNLSKEDVLRCK